MKKTIVTAICAAALTVSSLPAAGAVSATVTATPTRNLGQSVYVDNTRVYPTGYNIGGNNYFKLRDIAALVGFGVSYDAASQTVEISTERVQPNTSGITDKAVGGASAKMSNQRIAVDGEYVRMAAYQIGGNNYVKLRDVAENVGFAVNYENATGKVTVNPSAAYGSAPETSANKTTVTDATLRQWEQEMIVRINEERAKVGAPALVQDETLTEFAQFWSKYMAANTFRHSTIADMYAWVKGVDEEDVLNPDGSFSMSEEMGKEIDCLSGGENIAGGCGISNDPVSTDMQAFMTSEGHRRTILDPEWTRIGIGYALSPDGYSVHCTQEFGW